MDNRLVKGEETKAKILEAALKIASEEGTRSISAKKIADSAGISKSNVFHHFGSVDMVLKELLKEVCGFTVDVSGQPEIQSLEVLFDLLGEMTFTLKGKELSSYRVLFAYYYDVIYGQGYAEDIMQVKWKFVEFLIDQVKKIEGIQLPKIIAEMIAIDLDGMGMHYMLELDTEKYMAMWAKKSVMYIGMIKASKS